MKRTGKNRTTKTSRDNRRLQLRRELIRNLSSDELRDVHGGYEQCRVSVCEPDTVCY